MGRKTEGAVTSVVEPLSDFLLSKYVREVEYQCNLGMIAANAIVEKSTTDAFEVWSPVQSFLAAAAALRRLLFPNPATVGPGGQPLTEEEEQLRLFAVTRGKQLRKALDIRGGRPLEKVEVRNAFEHFDQRLDQLMFKIQDGQAQSIIIDRTIGSENEMFVIDGAPAPHKLRHFDPVTGVVSILGSRVDLGELQTDLAAVHKTASQWKPTKGS